jgi:hypothetical protein
MAITKRPVDTRSKALLEMQKGIKAGDVLDEIDYSYYDTMTLTTGLREVRMFTVQRGGAKSLAQTNMSDNGKMPQGKRMTVHGLKFSYIGSAELTSAGYLAWLKMLSNTTLEIKIDGKSDYGTWTLIELFGISAGIAVSDASGTNNVPLQDITSRAFPINKPIMLPANQLFEIVITNHDTSGIPNTFNNDTLKVSLTGMLETVN